MSGANETHPNDRAPGRSVHSGTDSGALALFTDLYELTMVQAYLAESMTDTAVFSLFVRRLPERRNYLLACGMASAIGLLETLHFSEEDTAYLASLPHFSDDFLDWARDFRFTGEVHAVPDGTPVFANEPILEVSAPLPQAQLLETLIMNQVSVQTVLASKAARIVTAADGRAVLDFAPRRMHGIDAALKGALAFHIAGVAATSNLLAGKRYGVPVAGTMAHSYVQAHHDEKAAFRAFLRLYPDTVVLVDTYDTLAGVEKVIGLAGELGGEFRVRGIRLDSGDLAGLAREARRRLDAAGLTDLQIFASSGLDEYRIAELLAAGAPIDGFGVGTHLGVAGDAPDLDIVYKLCEYGGRGRVKLSSEKPILPGRKQIHRLRDGEGRARGDVIARAGEAHEGHPLLRCAMRGGSRLEETVMSLDAQRRFAQEEIAALPAEIRSIEAARTPYPVRVSEALERHRVRVIEEVTNHGESA